MIFSSNLVNEWCSQLGRLDCTIVLLSDRKARAAILSGNFVFESTRCFVCFGWVERWGRGCLWELCRGVACQFDSGCLSHFLYFVSNFSSSIPLVIVWCADLYWFLSFDLVLDWDVEVWDCLLGWRWNGFLIGVIWYVVSLSLLLETDIRPVLFSDS